MRKLLIMAAAGLALSACTASFDAALKENLPKTCSAIETAHAAFVAIAVVRDLPTKTMAREDAVYQGTRPACADPEHVTSGQALVLAAQAYLTITMALKDARNAP